MVASLLVAGAALAYLALANLEEHLVYYWTPSDLLAKGGVMQDTTIRLGGMVLADSLHWDADRLTLSFTLGESASVPGPSVLVVSTGVPPAMLRPGVGCVVEGRYDGRVFRADRLLVKHSNEYRPPATTADRRKLHRTLLAPAPPSPAGESSP